MYGAGAPVEVLSGPAAVRRRLVTMQRQARSEVCTFVPARHMPALLSFEDNHEEADSEMMRRGVTVRSVVERAWLEHPATAAVMGACVAQGQHISVTDRLPTKLVIGAGGGPGRRRPAMRRAWTRPLGKAPRPRPPGPT